jgi:membrane-associated HD superfamily phosphohydrolase
MSKPARFPDAEVRNRAPEGPQCTLAYTRHLVLTALCVALGLVLPWVFHLVGGGQLGSMFLPMFLPLLLLGLLVPPGLAVLGGALTPLLSSALTGMPPAPILPEMVIELAVLAGGAALLHHTLRLHVWLAAAVATVLSRAGMVLILVVFGSALGYETAGWALALATLVKGLPGTVLLLTLIPPLALSLEKHRRIA